MENLKESMEGLRLSTRIEREAESILRSEGVAPGLPIIAEKCGSGGDGNIPLTTNIYGILTRQAPVYRYDITVKASITKDDGTVKWSDFTKKASGDAVVIDRRDRCRDVFIVFKKRNSEFLKQPKSVFFDLQSIMYSMLQLDVKEGETVKFDIPIAELPKNFSHFSGCQVEIRRVDKDFQLTVGDLSCVSRNLTDTEHSMAQFLDLVTSQHIIFSPEEHITFSSNSSFLLDPMSHGFTANDNACFDDNGSYLAIGAKKSIRFVEGPKRGRSIALIVETKKTPFHTVETLLEKAKRMVRDIRNVTHGTLHRLNSTLTGLYVETSHLNRSQQFFVRGIDVDNAQTKMIEVDGNNMSVCNYFKKKYKITLKEPLAPLVRARGKNNTICYVPMELCTVVDNQRLKTNQQTPKQVQDMIKKCAVPPSVLVDQNIRTFNSLHLNQNNAFLANAGIRVVEHPFGLNGRQIPPPTMIYGKNAKVNVNLNNFMWNGKHYLIPAACESWVAYAFLSSRDRLTDHEFECFIQRFVTEAGYRGMRLSRPSVIRVCDVSNLKKVVEESACAGKKYLFAVHPDSADDIHNSLKLYERQYRIVTQAIRIQTLNGVMHRNQKLTLGNILLKANVKLGGLNYSVTINSPGAADTLMSGTLIIGISSNHPGLGGPREDENSVQGKSGKLSAPSIVGYAANYGISHEFEFYGDFVCQQPLREEKVEVIRQIVERCLTKYRENRKANPKRVVIYRNGASEGNFPMILKYEVPLIKMCLAKNKCAVELNIIVPNKMQSIRFFNKQIDKQARAMDQNIKPGLVVDHSVVHSDYSEFFLNSHRALQGSAKTPKYTVIYNDSRFTLEQFEAMTYILCYGHQIVEMPTSLPCAVYIAGRYAERGRKLYTSSSGNTAEDYSDLTKQLCYYDTPLANCRVNA